MEQLARRGRPRRPAGVADITVESAITQIAAGQLRYRGLDAVRLAASRSFEDVAELLWTGELPASPGGRAGQVLPQAAPPASWQATPAALEVGPGRAGRAAGRDAAAGAAPGHRAGHGRHRSAAAAPGPAGGARGGPEHHRRAGGLPAPRPAGTRIGHRAPGHPGPTPHRASGSGSDRIADRLWSRLRGGRPSPALLRALSAALVLLADHELAASTLAARAAASVRADPYAVVQTGMAAVSGALHGGASLGAETMLAAASGPDDVPRVVGELLRRGEHILGFGHFAYPAGDPRAVLLLGLVRRAAPKSGQLAVADAVLAEARRKSLPEPNIDFAVATLARVAGMIRGSGETIFAVSRTAGWIAHALEAYAGHRAAAAPRRLHRTAPGRAIRPSRRRPSRRQPEPLQPRGVGQDLDRDDRAVRDGEAEHRDEPAVPPG